MKTKSRSQLEIKLCSPNPRKPTKEKIAEMMYLDDNLKKVLFRSEYRNGQDKTPRRPPQFFELFFESEVRQSSGPASSAQKFSGHESAGTRLAGPTGSEVAEPFGLPLVFQKLEQPLDKAFLISDTHFSEKRIITKASRPFATVKQMDHVLCENWNRAVQSDCLVFMLGDFGDAEKAKKLSGRITYILGNHDKHIAEARDYQLVEFDGKQFVLAHHPYRDKLPFTWEGWLIHGHAHNFDLWGYPFISGTSKTINVSAELINYSPLSVQRLLSLDLDSIYQMSTLDSKPTLW